MWSHYAECFPRMAQGGCEENLVPNIFVTSHVQILACVPECGKAGSARPWLHKSLLHRFIFRHSGLALYKLLAEFALAARTILFTPKQQR